MKTRASALTPESIERFRNWLSARGRSPHTCKAYATDLKMLLEDLGESTLSMEEYEDLGQAWLQQSRRTLAPRTTARRVTSLREFAKWAGYPELVQDYLAPDPGPAIPHPLPEGMDGVRRMLAATDDDRKQALIALCGMMGLRVAEAIDTEYGHFNFENRDRPILKVRGKGDVVRYVPVSKEAMSHLTMALGYAMINGGTLVRMHDRFARRVITSLGEAAGLSRSVASHDLRATFATAVYNRTRDQRLVQMLLGHKTGRTTEGYIGVAIDTMVAGVEGL